MYRLFFLIILVCSFTVSANQRIEHIIINAPDNYYVIQLASVEESASLKKLVSELAIKKQVIAIRTSVSGQRRWAIIEGIYLNYNEALINSHKLKEQYSTLSPWVRSMKSLKKDLITTR